MNNTIDYYFSELRPDPIEIQRTASFLADVFGKSSVFNPSFIHWQYFENPNGPVIGYNTVARENTVASHYAVQPFEAVLSGHKIKAALSLNTATARAHRRKNLFPLLAKKTYDLASEKGIQLIVGVANQNSVHSIVKKLGFQNLGPLCTAIGYRELNTLCDNENTHYHKNWERESLLWRLSDPNKQYEAFRANERREYYCASGYPGIKVSMGIFPDIDAGCPLKRITQVRFLKLWIGLHPQIRRSPPNYFSLPLFIRPSPLYLIMKDLTGQLRLPKREEICFRAIDFDVY